MTAVQGASWATPVAFACRCGVVFRASRWRWIDRDVQPDEAERARIEGPVRGNCPRCLEPAHARIDWVELRPSLESASLILGPHQRHELIEVLRDHAGAVRERVVGGFEVEEWLLSPTWVFGELETGLTTKPEASVRSRVLESGPIEQPTQNSRPEVVVSDDSEDLSADLDDSDEDTAKRRAPVDEAHTDGVPKPVGSTPWPAPTVSPTRPLESLTYVGALTIDRSTESEDMITLDLELGEAGRGLWGQAALQARPIHLRDHGYPLIGVRLVASYLGRNSVIEGVVDVGSDEAADVFASLSRRFRVMLVLRGEGSSTVHREAAARDLERNAALCLESARASLARREYPRDAYRLALESLGNSSLDDRLRGAAHPLVAGSYRHLIAPRETWLALEALEAASDKANLAQLLEVDGLSVDEYEAIRKRVLVASVEHGLCAPRRFWRRILASGLADDFDNYAAGLARSRAEADQDGDDLDADQRAAAWARVAELCDIKQLEYPTELRRKLGLGLVSEPSQRRRARQVEAATDVPAGDPVRSRSASGEIRARPGGSGGQGNLRDQLRDPTLRLRVATASLAKGSTPEAIDGVFTVIDQFGEDELLAVMPAIAELGTQAVVSLHDKLDSPNQQLRQAAAILLGLTRDPASIAPLLRRLVREESRIWLDVARAIGALGPSVLERLSAAVRQGVRSDSAVDRTELGNRVARAMAEVVIAGGPTSEARDTLESLAHSLEPEIAVTASRALATLGEVSLAGAEVRGERSLIEVTKLRGFARRAYEAITVPELDLDEEVEAEFV